jgi:hypothetical protein
MPRGSDRLRDLQMPHHHWQHPHRELHEGRVLARAHLEFQELHRLLVVCDLPADVGIVEGGAVELIEFAPDRPVIRIELLRSWTWSSWPACSGLNTTRSLPMGPTLPWQKRWRERAGQLSYPDA